MFKLPQPLLQRLARPRALAWLGLGLLTAIAVGGAGHWAERRELQAKTAELRQAAEVYSLALRGVAERYDYLPYAAARHPEVLALLAQPDRPEQRQQVNRYFEDLRGRTDSAALYVMDLNGLALAASNWATPNSFVGQSYRQRPYFEQASQGVRNTFYGVGLTTGAPGLFIAEPVRDQGGAKGVVKGVVAVKVGLDELSQAWAKAAAPVLLQDSRGIVFLSSEPEWLYRSRRPLSPEDLAWLARHEQYGPPQTQTYPALPWRLERAADQAEYRLHTRQGGSQGGRQRELLALDTPLPELGWTLTVSTDLAEVAQARRQALALAALGAAVLLLAALGWQQRERRFAEQREARQELELRVQERTRDLQLAHAFRKAMEDSLLVGMRARNREGRIIYVNPALCEMVGYRADELLGCLPPYPYWHPDELDRHQRDSEAALQGRAAPQGFESRIRHRDGHDVITMVYTAPLIDEQGQHLGWMSSVVDISAQRQAEQRQREQALQLQRSARLASLGEMASTLAHELNQPLMALSNFALAAQALARQGPPELLQSALGDIVAQARRAGEIVQRVRGLIRPQGGQHQACELAQVVERVQGLLQTELTAAPLRLDRAALAALPPVRGDRLLLEQLLINLLQNALQATEHLPAARRTLELSASVQGEQVELCVADHGPGVSAALREQVFNPFFSTKSDGLGLGLNICRTLVEAHGGQLGVRERSDGQPGAVFFFTLPLMPQAAFETAPT